MVTRGEKSRLAILEAAIVRFGRSGYRATAVADIARDAGVSGTLAYAYFDNKKALFLAALDEDIVGVVQEGVSTVLETTGDNSWRTTLIFNLVAALDHHPLARRMLAGLEPDVTDRLVELPALENLRKAVATRMQADQVAGLIRDDIDTTSIANGTVTIFISMLMSVVQFGSEGIDAYGADVLAVIEAAIDPR